MTLEFFGAFCRQPLWDVNLSWNTTNPDFTPCFEHTVLIWLPCFFLWLFAPIELYLQNAASAKPLPWTPINIARMGVAVTLVAVSISDILETYFNRRTGVMFEAMIVSYTLKLTTFILSIVLMGRNKKRGRHTSGIVFLFWFFLAICEMVRYRTILNQLQRENMAFDEAEFISAMIYFPLLATEFVLCCVADVRPKQVHHSEDLFSQKAESPEQCASFLSTLTFGWFNRMCMLGWKKPLTTSDIWPLNTEDCTKYITEKFSKHQNLLKRDKANHSHVVWSLCKTFWPYFILGSACKLFFDILQFVSPLVLKLLIEHVQSKEPLWKGIFYAFLLFSTGCVQSLILGQYFHRMYVLGMRVRSALVSAIYQKSLVLSSTSRRGTTVGEIVNLMSVDSQRFMDLMTYLNLVWSAPFQIFMSVLLLWNILGPSVLAGLLVMVIILPVNAIIASKTKSLQVSQMKNKDERIKLVNEVLSGIKVIKLYAWEEAFKEQIFGIRYKEVQQLWKIAYWNSFSFLLWTCSPFLVALASFGTYVLIDERNILDATTAFVSLSLFNILRFPLTMLPNLITTMVLVNVSVKRINSFIHNEELEDYVVKGNSMEQPIIVHNGYFGWNRETEMEKQTLRDINLTIKKGMLVAVVGQVGSGKSSLLSALLGEMEKIKGQVTISGSTALVSQQPWIQNTTMLKNITFSKPFDKDLYRDILEACSLLPDLEILPGGDQTEIGEKGINLSGGQKQRLSLARAIYSSADIYFLDDPLSAVDSHVGRHIFNKVIGKNGLLGNKTRILVTHGLTYLPQTDIVIVMKDGKVAEFGTFKELVEHKGPFSDFLSQYFEEQNTTQDDLDIIQSIGHPELLRSLSDRSYRSDLSDSDDKQKVLSVNSQPVLQAEKRLKTSASNKNLIQVETTETGEVVWSVYMQYMKAVNLKWVAAIFATYTLSQLFSVGTGIWLSEWGTDKPGENGTQIIAQRNLRLGVYGGLGFGQAFASLLGTYAFSYSTLWASNALHNGLLQNVLHLPMSFFDTTPIGRIVNRFSKDVDTLDITIPMTVRAWLSCLLQVLSTLVIISMQTPIFMSVILPIGILYYFIQKFYVPTSRQLKRLESITRSPIYSHFSETLAGSSTIRAYGHQRIFCEQSNTLVDNNQVCYYPSIISNRWLAIRLDFCGNCVIFFAALFAILKRGDLSAGEVGLSVSYALVITSTLNWFVRMNCELETNIVAVERILEYTNEPTEAPYDFDIARIPTGWPIHGNIQFQNYSTRYRPGLNLVLKNINCNLAPGEKIGIVGRTGSGKSSLTLTLFRIIEAVSGSISIDDICLSDVGLRQLRSRITIIPQDPVLFSGTLQMNLDPFCWYTEKEIWEALEHAHLKNFILSLEQGILHEIVEGGENLSVGQRQLVCLARALLRKTKVLILDEATAAVDLETDDLIQSTIKRQFAECTVLTIAHRLNTVVDHNRIMVLDKGAIVEFDTPTNLLKNEKSIFYGMAKAAGIA